MKTTIIIISLLLLVIGGCRCLYVRAGDTKVLGCSLMSDTGIENAVIEPNCIKSGLYTGDTDRIKLIYPPIMIETE